MVFLTKTDAIHLTFTYATTPKFLQLRKHIQQRWLFSFVSLELRAVQSWQITTDTYILQDVSAGRPGLGGGGEGGVEVELNGFL